jgi:hypothetical protein
MTERILDQKLTETTDAFKFLLSSEHGKCYQPNSKKVTCVKLFTFFVLFLYLRHLCLAVRENNS